MSKNCQRKTLLEKIARDPVAHEANANDSDAVRHDARPPIRLVWI
jgi:hypothetical protein